MMADPLGTVKNRVHTQYLIQCNKGKNSVNWCLNLKKRKILTDWEQDSRTVIPLFLKAQEQGTIECGPYQF